MPLNIVLFEPEIPNNTGNIGRLCMATGSNLHLVGPYGFEINDTRLRRAGLDYWKNLSIYQYDSIDSFYFKNSNSKMIYFSSHAQNVFWNISFEDNIFLIFGKESEGLPKSILNLHRKSLYKIPIINNQVRSLNISNAVSIIVYEGLRQLNY